MTSPLLFLRTVRHLRFSQVINRAVRIVSRIGAAKKYRVKHFACVPDIQPVRFELREQANKAAVKQGSVFTFLNQTFDTKYEWFPHGVSRLWLYNLHYLDWVFELQAHDFQAIVTDWIEKVPVGAKNAWHPYTVSLRIGNLIWYYSAHTNDFQSDFKLKLVNSIYNQTKYLAANLEFDVLGNHLIENCEALIISGVFFNNNKWRDKGLKILDRQLKEQILPDGGHYERSPMYHCIVLEDLLAVHQALLFSGITDALWLTDAIRRMTIFLDGICINPVKPKLPSVPVSFSPLRVGEGPGVRSKHEVNIPLLNDSAYGIAFSPDILLNYAKEKTSIEIPRDDNYTYINCKDTGIHIVKHGSWRTIFDVGQICPDFLPAHAHNDMLSILLWHNNQPVLTDSGVYEYASGEWRNYFRSSKAHNTVTIDNIEQNEIYSSFRVGRRGKPYGFTTNANGSEATCFHNCYRHIKIETGRKIALSESGIMVHDIFKNSGKSRPFVSALHFAPGFRLKSIDGNKSQTALSNGNIDIMLSLLSPGIYIKEYVSWYSPEFGIKTERLCLHIEGCADKGTSEAKFQIIKVT
jgi:hypothetical protein